MLEVNERKITMEKRNWFFDFPNKQNYKTQHKSNSLFEYEIWIEILYKLLLLLLLLHVTCEQLKVRKLLWNFGLIVGGFRFHLILNKRAIFHLNAKRAIRWWFTIALQFETKQTNSTVIITRENTLFKFDE